MNHDRMAVLQAMTSQGVIPVFFHPDTEVCLKVIQACANGGAKCIEFTNRGDFAAQTFLDVARHFAKADPSVIMGVGSVVDAPTAGLFIANGAKFVVGPIISEIAISAPLVNSTDMLISTMAHEMIHLYQDETGTARGHHNPKFRKLAKRVCAIHGFDPETF